MRFHDGVELTAGDVVFTLELLRSYGVRSTYADALQLIEAVQARGRYAVEIDLSRPTCDLLYALNLGILPRHRLEGQDPARSSFIEHPIGTGPFRVAGWSPQEVVLEAFEEHFRGRPYLDRVAVGPLYPASGLADPGLSPYPYEPRRALDLLKEAGWEDADGDGLLEQEGRQFAFSLSVHQGDEIFQGVALALQQQLLEIGIRVLIRPLSLPALIPLLLCGTASILTSWQASHRLVAQGNLNVARQVAERIDLYVTGDQRILRALAESLGHVGLQDWQMEAILRSYALNFDEFRSIHLADLSGRALLSSRLQAGPVNLTHETAFRQAGRGSCYRSGIYLAGDLTSTITLATPVRRRDRIEGVLVAQVNLLDLWRMVDEIRIGQRGYALVVSESGQLIAHGRHEAKVGILRLLVLGPLFLALMVATGVWCGRRQIVRPIQALIQGTRRVGSGELSQPVEFASQDELAQLSQAFNRMMEQLVRLQADIRKSERLATFGPLSFPSPCGWRGTASPWSGP